MTRSRFQTILDGAYLCWYTYLVPFAILVSSLELWSTRNAWRLLGASWSSHPPFTESIIACYYHVLLGMGIFNLAYKPGITLAHKLDMYQDHDGGPGTESPMQSRHSKFRMALDGARVLFFGLIAPTELLYATLDLCESRSQRHTFTWRRTSLIDDIIICYRIFLLQAVLFILAHKIILRLGRRFGFYQDRCGATAHTTRAKSEIQIFLDGFYTVFLGLHVPVQLLHRAINLWQCYRADPSSIIEDDAIHLPGIWLQVGIFGLAYEISVALARKSGLYQDSGDMELEAPAQSNANRTRTLPRPEYPTDGQWAAEPVLIE